MTSRVCPECDSKNIIELTFDSKVPYRDAELDLQGRKYSVCEDCGCEFIDPDQNRYNDKLLNDARRHFDGMLTSDEIQNIRRKLDINQAEAALMFGGGRNAFSKYETGTVNQSLAMDRLLRISVKYPAIVSDLAKMAGIELDRKVISMDLYKSAAILAEDFKPIGAANMSTIHAKQAETNEGPWSNQA